MATLGTTSAPQITGLGVGDTTPDDQNKGTQPPYAQLPTMQYNNTDNIIGLSPDALEGKAADPAFPAPQPPPQVRPANTPPPTAAMNGNDAVLQAAQNLALNQPSTGLTNQLTAMTSDYLKNPNLGFDYGKYNQSQLEKYDREQSAAMEAARQKLGDTSQSGELQRGFLKNQMDVAAGRQQLGANLDYKAQQDQISNIIKALGEGRSTQESADKSTTAQIGNLTSVRAAGEGERSQTEGQKNAVELSNLGYDQDIQKMAIQNGYDLYKLHQTFGNEMTALIVKQDFEKAQNVLDRNLQTSLQANDIAATKENIQKQLDFDQWKTETGYQVTAAENAMNRSLQLTLKDLDIQGQKDMMELKGKIDKGLLLDEQEFKASEAALDRALQTAIQQNDIQGQLDCIKAKGEIDKTLQENQQNFQKAENLAQRLWQTDERLSTQDHQLIMQQLDIKGKQMLQAGDIQGQKEIENLKAANQLAMQTAGFKHDERMAYLDDQYQQAKDSRDFERQKQILDYTHRCDLEKIDKEQGYEAANIQARGQIEKSIAEGNWQNAQTLQTALLKYNAGRDAQQFEIDQKRLALEERGVNYSQIQQAVEAGQIDPQAAGDFLKNAMKTFGIDIKPPDPTATNKELVRRYEQSQIQYGLSHPEFLVDPKDPTKGITDAGKAAFAKQYNSAEYGESGILVNDLQSGKTPATDVIGNPDKVQSLATNPAIPTLDISARQKGGKWYEPVRTWHFSAPMDAIAKKGNIFKVNGKVYQVTEDGVFGYQGSATIRVIDMDTGKPTRIVAGIGDEALVNSAGK